jgi:hypothetical protein
MSGVLGGGKSEKGLDFLSIEQIHRACYDLPPEHLTVATIRMKNSWRESIVTRWRHTQPHTHTHHAKVLARGQKEKASIV